MLVPPCFHTPLRVERVLGTARDWQLLEPLVFESALLRGFLVLPGGAVVNFASTPPIVWSVLPPTGMYDWATAMHDGAYRGLLVTLTGQRIRLIRLLADYLLLEAAEATGVSREARTALFHGVRLFGEPHYRGVPDGTL
jgi:hypothetical protein